MVNNDEPNSDFGAFLLCHANKIMLSEDNTFNPPFRPGEKNLRNMFLDFLGS